MFEENPEESAEEAEEEVFEKAIDSEGSGVETPEEELEEVSVPRAPSFSLNSLEMMLSVDELLVKALSNPESLREAAGVIKKLREKSTTSKKPQRKPPKEKRKKSGKKGEKKKK